MTNIEVEGFLDFIDFNEESGQYELMESAPIDAKLAYIRYLRYRLDIGMIDGYTEEEIDKMEERWIDEQGVSKN